MLSLQGICVPEMPNYFIMFGPNTIAEMTFMTERAAMFLAAAVCRLARSGCTRMSVRPELARQHTRTLHTALASKETQQPP